ncbi:MAG: hypothetical protein IKX67_07230 [Bacteroidales bacterium]|nr:hypothetical protein [Bacteroidales bacterium]
MYSHVDILSTPALDVSGFYGFGVSIDDEERQNAIYMGGYCYQLTETDDRDRCKACALRIICVGTRKPCAIFEAGALAFEDSDMRKENGHFEKVKTY